MKKNLDAVLGDFAVREDATLPLLFLNSEGDPEPADEMDSRHARRMTATALASADRQIEMRALWPWHEQSEATARNRLRRALLETAQLRMMPKDALSQICFTGIGDPERLVVESLPADSLVPSVDFDSPGRLCSLAQAESILRRLYLGETSADLAGFLRERQRIPCG
jgi:hypothetical protein